MKDKFLEVIRAIREWWKAAAKRTKIIVCSVTGGLLALLLVLTILLNQKNYVLLYNGVSPQENAEILVTLREMAIEPKITNTGAIYVEDSLINRVRMQLAQNGFEGNTFDDYSIYNQGNMTSTQAERNQRKIFQDQTRLQDTIEVYDEIETAVVTINSPQPSIYVMQDSAPPPSANVTVKLKRGKTLTANQVQAILNLIRTSVPGIADEDIAIADSDGDLKYILDSMGDGSATKLELTEKINRAIRDRVLEMLYPVYGRENVVAEVHVVLDTDKVSSTKTEYYRPEGEDPNYPYKDYEEITREKLGGAAGPVEGVVGANDNIDVPQYQARDVIVDDADSYVARDVIDYLVNSLREEVQREGYQIQEGTSVAVIVNANAVTLTREQLGFLADSVSKASGVISDYVSVQNFAFWNPAAEPSIIPPVLSFVEILAISVIGVLALAIAIIMLIARARRKRREAELAAEEAEAAALAAMLQEEEEQSLLELMGREEEFEPIVIPETQETKLKTQIKDLADSDPEIVAQLLKSWLLSS